MPTWGNHLTDFYKYWWKRTRAVPHIRVLRLYSANKSSKIKNEGKSWRYNDTIYSRSVDYNPSIHMLRFYHTSFYHTHTLNPLFKHPLYLSVCIYLINFSLISPPHYIITPAKNYNGNLAQRKVNKYSCL